MVTNPLDYVEPLGKAGASGLGTSKDNWKELIQNIKSHGMRPGVSIKPGTSVEEVYPLCFSLVEAENPVEMVLVMTVEPGFGGQKFMPGMMDKVDGGLGPSTIDVAASAGANCIVVVYLTTSCNQYPSRQRHKRDDTFNILQL
ncbi:putative ribulose-phosphate 3-epimerase [Medicago truncatula]|uniref:Putative ribulose-phosphate 3-epimerase n=1 Tax=Medicago truncatula TaxID=3880 RepID=A0A396IPV1_MEDTR|nr:putative ribulose-phosphate 3-epimerase [Medicago truncatula]